MDRVIGIVGAEAKKFTPVGEARARALIRSILMGEDGDGWYNWLSSGRSPLGGIDVWAEEEAIKLGHFRSELIFPAHNNRWEPHGFKERNLQIAEASWMVHCIAVDRLPSGYKGMTFSTCYHCDRHTRGAAIQPRKHVKSGGCWTMYHCVRSQLHVIENE